MDEARSLTYSINLRADTSQAESNLRDITSNIGNLNHQADSVGSAFRRSFLSGIDSGNSFSSSIRDGVSGAFEQISSNVIDFRNNANSTAQAVGNGFAHPIATIKNGLGKALQAVRNKFIDMARGAEDAEEETDELGETASNTENDINDVGDAAEKSGNKFSAFGGVLKGIGVALVASITGLTALSSAAVKAGAEYETAFAKVETIMDTSQMSTDEMSISIKELSSEMGIAASELSDTVYNAISATGDTANSIELASQASKLATAGFTDTSSALSVLTTTVNAYKMSAGEAEKISDSLIQVQNLGVTTVAELSANMGNAIATASAYGVNLTNLESAYVSITKAGINTAEGTTYISGMMNELGDTGSGVAKILKEKTGKSFDQLMGEGKSLGDVLGILNDSVNGDSTALMNLWSSAEAGKASAAIIGQGLDTFNENLIAIGESTGATEKAYSIMADTLEHKTSVFKTSGANLLSSIYEGMSGELGGFVDFANGAIDQLADAFEEGGLPALMGALGNVLSEGLNMVVGMLPDFIDAGLQLLGALGQGLLDNLSLIIDAAIQIVTSVGDGILKALPKVAEAAITIITTLATSIGSSLPTLIPTVVTTVTTLVGTLIENLPLLIDAGMQLLGGLVQGIIDATPLLIEQLPILINQVITSLTESLPLILEQGVQILMSLAIGIINAVPLLIEQLPNIITGIIGFVTENLPLIVEAGVNLLVQLTTGIIQAIPQLVESLPQIISAIVGGLAELPGMMLEIGGNLVKGLWEGIQGLAGWIWDQISGWASSIWDGICGFFGIHSPSTKLAWVGEMMVDGLAGSIDKNGDEAVEAAEGMSENIGSVFDSAAYDITPSVADVSYDIKPIVEDFNPPDVSASVVYGSETEAEYKNAGGETSSDDSGGSESNSSDTVIAFSPVININVNGDMSEEGINNISESLRETVRQLYMEFREEELERMALKQQYAF